MSEQSGCDPQAAVRARLKGLMVDGEATGDWEGFRPVHAALRERREQAPVGAIVNLSDDPLTDEQYEILRRQWEKLQDGSGHLRTIIIEEPLLFIPLVPDYPPTPGDDQ